MMKKPLTKRLHVCYQQKDAPSRISMTVTWISLAISLFAAAFAGWQAWVAKQTYSVNLKQAKISESQAEVSKQALQTAEQANAISQKNIQLVEKQLKRAAIEEEIKRLDAVNAKLSSGYLSVLSMGSLKSNFEITKKKFMEQTSYFSFDEKNFICMMLDDYRLYFVRIAPLIRYVNRSDIDYKVLSDFAQNVSLLSFPNEISKWTPQQYERFQHKILNDINNVNAILKKSIEDNQKRIITLQEQLQKL